MRTREGLQRPSFLELYFDLAFIVALTRLSQRIAADVSWGNALRAMVLLAAVWWVFTVTAYTTNWFDPDEPVIQLLVLGVMLGGLLLALTIPTAFEGPNAIVFAGAYVAVHVGRGLLLAWALKGHQLRYRSLRVVVWFGVTGVPLMVGAFLGGTTQLVLWAVALAVDYAVGWFGYPVPGRGRTPPEELRVLGEHLSERFRQMFIVALGEIILVAALAYRSVDFSSPQTVAFVLVFVNTVLMWRIYFVRSGRWLGPGLEHARKSGQLAVLVAHAHLIMIAGAVLTAVGAELAIRHPAAPTPGAWVVGLTAGPAVFLLGRILFAVLTVWMARVRGIKVPIPWRLLLGLLAILAVAPALSHLPPLGVAAVIDGILLGIASAKTAQIRGQSRSRTAGAER
ncbi:low temperature requirement protein A [Micromonospora sp. NPDC049559]|uniref:low temperature requirement protein A n=1 Tax=Micromonospora sp. NPDC049559 TaxID=3155923 RepID=UPI003443ED35